MVKVRHSISLLLIGLILFNSCGYYLMLPALHLANKRNILNYSGKIHEKDLIHFTIPYHQLNQLNFSRGTEFSYNGELYDVIDRFDNGTAITFLCRKDHKDNRIVKQLKNNIQEPIKHNPTNRGNHRLLDGIIKTAMLVKNCEIRIPVRTISFSNPSNLKYASPWLSPPDLPPQYS